MKKQVLAVSAALFLSAICLGAMRAVPAKAAAQETAAVAIGGTAIVYQKSNSRTAILHRPCDGNNH